MHETYAFIYPFYKWGNWNQETFYSCLRLQTLVFMQKLWHKKKNFEPNFLPLFFYEPTSWSSKLLGFFPSWGHGYGKAGGGRVSSERKGRLLNESLNLPYRLIATRLPSDSYDKSCSLKSLSSATAAHNPGITIRGVISKLWRTAQQGKF